MDYIGSKAKIEDWIFQFILRKIGDPQGLVFCDGCSGSGVMSRSAAKLGFNVVSNDIMAFPSTIVNGSIGVGKNDRCAVQSHLYQMSKLRGRKGFFYDNFTPASNPPRMYFTKSNAKKIDSFRYYIEKNVKDQKQKDYLLWICLEALSRVSNTTGVQAAYLKEYKDRAKDDISKHLVARKTIQGKVTVYSQDILSLVGNVDYNILYIDPPYNTRQYGPNYHLYETFVRYDNPILAGKTGLRDWKSESDSQFCSKKSCLDFLEQIATKNTASFLFMSYNSDGLLSKSDILGVLMSCGYICECHEKLYKRYKSDVSDSRQYNKSSLYEYLFTAEK